MNIAVYNSILNRKKQPSKSFAVLVDPDKIRQEQIGYFLDQCNKASVDLIFVGGSLVVSDQMESLVTLIKKESSIPVVLFPGSPSQVTPAADALLYLSLISGRNPELLIGQHVVSAPLVRKSGLEVMSTGYMVIDGGAPTTVSYISNATPIPCDKNEIAVCTAMAGEMLGMKLIYMDAGSGAKNPITSSMIQSVSSQISIPLIVGGGIRDAEQAFKSANAGADIIVVGNAIEKDASLILEIGNAIHSASVLLS
jgi:putative glycerol-1-phosphate prenyltransferase